MSSAVSKYKTCAKVAKVEPFCIILEKKIETRCEMCQAQVSYTIKIVGLARLECGLLGLNIFI